MILRLSFKTPDVLDNAIDEKLKWADMPTREKVYLAEDIREVCTQWVSYGEYIRVEIDTEKNTAVVLEN